MFESNIIFQWMEAHPFLAFLIMTWSLVWKGIATWQAARNNHQKWFIALFIVNSLGILDILYVYVFSKPKPEEPAKA